MPKETPQLPLDFFEASAERALELVDAQKQAALAKERMEQVAAGRCNIRPFPTLATQPFRSELTIEQNSLFVSNGFRDDFFSREWMVKHPSSGEPVTRRVSVGKVNETDRGRGVLTQTHQDVFYQLLQLWDKQGYPVIGERQDEVYGYFTISAYKLVTTLRNSDNAREYRRVQVLLQDLASIPIVLENTYTWQGLVDREQFTLLSSVRWNEKAVDKTTRRPTTEGVSAVTILFSIRVTEGFLNKHIKTLLATPYKSLREARSKQPSEIARLLYPFLDAQLATKPEYHSRLAPLAERFGLRVFPYKSQRRDQFTPAMNALNGHPIHGGKFVLEARLDKAADDKDYVLVANAVGRKACR